MPDHPYDGQGRHEQRTGDPAPRDPRDDLALDLPDWDLVPAAEFVRRPTRGA